MWCLKLSGQKRPVWKRRAGIRKTKMKGLKKQKKPPQPDMMERGKIGQGYISLVQYLYFLVCIFKWSPMNSFPFCLLALLF